MPLHQVQPEGAAKTGRQIGALSDTAQHFLPPGMDTVLDFITKAIFPETEEDVMQQMADTILPDPAALYHGTSTLRLPGLLRAKKLLPRRDPVPRPSWMSNQPHQREAAFLSDAFGPAENFATTKSMRDTDEIMRNSFNDLSPTEFDKLVEKINEIVKPLILNFDERIRPFGTRDLLFPDERALMFREGVSLDDLVSAMITDRGGGNRRVLVPSELPGEAEAIENLLRELGLR